MCDSPKCLQKEANEKRERIFQQAQRLANETGQWVGIYTDEYGQKQFIRGDQSTGFIVEQYISPKL